MNCNANKEAIPLMVMGASISLNNIDSVSVIPDRIEAGTFLIAVAATGGEVKLNNVNPIHSETVISHLKKANINLTVHDNSIVVSSDGKDINACNMETNEYPGFPTDLQAQIMVLMCRAIGNSKIQENIFENRFMHVPELNRMGAKIKIKGNQAIIQGKKKLNGAELMATDLRASVSLVLAALSSKSKTTINRVYHLDRGYENIEKKLSNCGAQIKRIK